MTLILILGYRSKTNYEQSCDSCQYMRQDR